MADSVLAIQNGFEYQALFFWYQASKLYLNESNVNQVAWEIDNLPGFDDVSLSYSPPKKSRYGYDVDQEYFQVKFHVAHNNAMTFESLIDPSFIGAVTESVLQKLYKNYVASPEQFARSTYSLVNIWGVDRSNLLANLLDNMGTIQLDKLFDGKGPRSKTGMARKLLSDHLGLANEDDLKILLEHFRILDNSKGLEGSESDMMFALNSVGLKTTGWEKRDNPYPNLIKRLHEEKKNQLTKESLSQILTDEDLWVNKSTEESQSYYRIGVRTFRRGTDPVRFETEAYLCLLHHFEGRYVVKNELWQTHIIPELVRLTEDAISQNKPILIHLDSHVSTAFAAGYLMDPKTGAVVSVVQKLSNGSRVIYSPSGSISERSNLLWSINHQKLNSENDIAVTMNVSRNIENDVTEYINVALPTVSNHISFSIKPIPGNSSIIDGNHIVQCVNELIDFLESNFKGNPNRVVHLFISSPNAFAFYLGRNSKLLGKIILYEFDFEKVKSGTYEPSVQLPIIY
jgi:hypothetical protein